MSLPVLRDDAISSTDHGFDLRLSLPWIRSLPLSSLHDIHVRLDGQEAPVRVRVGHNSVDPDALAGERVWWFIQDRVVLSGDRSLKPGRHHVEVSFALLIPYLPAGPNSPLILPFHAARELQLDAIVRSVSRDAA